jgi:hypothetical protein
MFKNLIIFSIILILSSSLFAQNQKTWYVDDLKDGKVGVGSVDDPFRELQTAIDRASDGDIIFILPGEYEAFPQDYVEELCGNCQNHQTKVSATRGFLIKGKGVHLIGSGSGNTVLITKAGYGVLFEHSQGSVISNLRITGGIRDTSGNATDAGIVAKYSTVTVRNVEIRDNPNRAKDVVVGIGGIFGRENSFLIIQNSLIQNNGWDGVALYRGANAVITDNTICDGRGAGIGITWDASAVVYRNKVSGYWKGIGSFGSSRAIVRNNAVFDNLGWGVIATGTSYMEMANNVITRNGNCGFAIWGKEATGLCTNNIITENGWKEQWVCPCVGVWMVELNPNFLISYNDVWVNKAGNYQDMPDQTENNGNISIDPKFKDKFDFTPQQDSLKNIGNPIFTDPDGSLSDLGIYGGPEAFTKDR